MRTGTFSRRWLALAAALAMTPAVGDELARGEQLVQSRCFVCHGANGESSSPLFPRLAGQHALYIERQLADYASGRRKSPTMQPMVAGLTAGDFRALGRYFESREPAAHEVENRALAQAGEVLYHKGKPATMPPCASCHGPQAGGSEMLPRLAGQHALYTENQLKAFTKRERTNDNAVMHVVATQLSEAEMKALAAYLSGLR